MPIVPFNQRHQMITHKNDPLSKLIIKHIHESNFPCGRDQTLAILRNKYWIPNIKGLIRKVITDYLHCRKASSTPNLTFMADSTKERLQHNHKPLQILVLIILVILCQIIKGHKLKRWKGEELSSHV